MSKKVKLLFAVIFMATTLFAVMTNCGKIEEQYSQDETIEQEDQKIEAKETSLSFADQMEETEYPYQDSIYRWDDQSFDFVSVGESEECITPLTNYSLADLGSKAPYRIEWDLLTDVHFKIKYFEKIQAEGYAPIFGETLKKIDKKEISIEGFVVLTDPKGEALFLSSVPNASCFFCGKASPASVMSVYLKKSKRYKIDDFIRFKGTLELNRDNPEDFYYILREAKEE